MLRRLAPGVALASTVALVMVGCSVPNAGADPSPSPAVSEVPTASTLVLNRAGEVFVQYSNAHIQAVTDGTPTPDAFAGLATEAQAAQAALEVDLDIQDGLSYVGAYSLDSIKQQELTESTLVATVCLVTSGVSVTDASGTPLQQAAPSPIEVTFLVPGGPLVDRIGAVPEGAEATCDS